MDLARSNARRRAPGQLPIELRDRPDTRFEIGATTPTRTRWITRRRRPDPAVTTSGSDYFLSAILRGLASALFQIVSVSTPASSLASTRSPSAVSGSEKLRENEPYCRS